MGGLKMVHQNQKMNPIPHMYIDNGQIAKMYAGGGVLLEKIFDSSEADCFNMSHISMEKYG